MSKVGLYVWRRLPQIALLDAWLRYSADPLGSCLFGFHRRCAAVCLSTETVEGLSLTLEGVDDIHGSDSLSSRVLSVGDGVTDDVL